MDDRYDEDLFLGYLEGDLTPEQVARFEKQLQENPRLRNLVAQVVLDRHRLRNMPHQAAPPELMERVNQRLERSMLLDAPTGGDSHEGPPIRRHRMGRWVAYGAVAAMVAVVAGFIFHWLWLPGAGNAPQAQEATAASKTAAPPAAAREAQARSPLARGRGHRPDLNHATPPAAGEQVATLEGARDDDAGGTNKSQGPEAAHRPDQEGTPKHVADPIETALSRLLGTSLVMGNQMQINRQTTGTPLADATVPIYEDLAEETGMGKRAQTKPFEMADRSVEVRAPSFEKAAAAVRTWAEQNDVTILDQAAATPTGGLLAGGAGGGGAPRPGAQAAVGTGSPTTLVLVMQDQLFDDLVAYLKLEAGDKATVAAVAAPPADEGRRSGGEQNKAAVAAAPMGVAAAPSAAPATQPRTAAPADAQLASAIQNDRAAAPAAPTAFGPARLIQPYAKVAVRITILPMDDAHGTNAGK